jgi:orotate phosphoribosyltransferase
VEQDEILEHFTRTAALLDGHFILSSGLHSPRYLQCALALQHPVDALMYGKAIADELAQHDMTDSVETVASPAIGGLIIGFAVAQALGVRFIWTERQNGEMTLRRGFTISPGEKIFVVEDVITTGGSTRECIRELEANGGRVVAGASIIDRSNGVADIGVPRVALASVDVPSYDAGSCPMCSAGTPAIKPGSRVSALSS